LQRLSKVGQATRGLATRGIVPHPVYPTGSDLLRRYEIYNVSCGHPKPNIGTGHSPTYRDVTLVFSNGETQDVRSKVSNTRCGGRGKK